MALTEIAKLTAETLLAAPRRGSALPNANGQLALYTLSTHKFGDKTTKEVRVMDLNTTSSSQLSDHEKVQDATWIPGSDDEVVYLKSGEKGHTEIIVASGADVTREHYVVADINAPIGDLKLKALDDGTIAFVVTGPVGDDGSLYNDDIVEKKSTGRIFDTARIHVWNNICSAQRLSLWYAKMVREDEKWKLKGDLVNAIQSESLELSGADDETADIAGNFDVSQRGIAFLALDVTQKKIYETLACSAYYIPIDDFTLPPTQKPHLIPTPAGVGIGAGSNIRISPDALDIGYLHIEVGGNYESRLYMASIKSPNDSFQAFDAFKHAEVDYESHDPADSFEFVGSSKSIIFTSQHRGRQLLSQLKLEKGEKPHDIYRGGTVSGWKPLVEGKWDRLLVSSSSYIDSSLWQVIDVEGGKVLRIVSSASDNGAKYGLSPDMVSEIWFQGADDIRVQSWVIRPSNFDESKKYPWVLLPHGGPVSTHSDSWSSRWNLAAWAEQGYVVVAPNVTGSPGFGVEFMNRINGEWGGRPVQDLLNLLQHLEQLPYLDQDKAVLAGASYGGYLVSWFLGHDIINKFCCAIWHDGVFSTLVSVLQDDTAFEDGSFQGPVYAWEHPEELEKWDPAKPERVRKWKNAPPTLIIHSDKDYRCNVADSFAMVKILHAQGVPTRYLNFSDEGHWVLKPENSLVWHNTVWDWMNRCVSGDLKRGDTKW